MDPTASPLTLNAAAAHLREHDPILAPVIEQHGIARFAPHTNYYQELVDAIISQQLSVKAARSIEKRFCELFGSSEFPPPEKILTKEVDELRTAGLSRAKAIYVRDLAEHVLSGKLQFDNFPLLSNDEIVAELTAVKGIGEWTAHMFLMFCLGRLDVLPVGDLGIKNGMQKLYNLEPPVTPEQMREKCRENFWHPYESVAAWYIWQSLDNTPK